MSYIGHIHRTTLVFLRSISNHAPVRTHLHRIYLLFMGVCLYFALYFDSKT